MEAAEGELAIGLAGARPSQPSLRTASFLPFHAGAPAGGRAARVHLRAGHLWHLRRVLPAGLLLRLAAARGNRRDDEEEECSVSVRREGPSHPQVTVHPDNISEVKRIDT